MSYMSLDTLESIPNIFVLILFYLFFHIEVVKGIFPYLSVKNIYQVLEAWYHLVNPFFKLFELRCCSVYFTWLNLYSQTKSSISITWQKCIYDSRQFGCPLGPALGFPGRAEVTGTGQAMSVGTARSVTCHLPSDVLASSVQVLNSICSLLI